MDLNWYNSPERAEEIRKQRQAADVNLATVRNAPAMLSAQTEAAKLKYLSSDLAQQRAIALQQEQNAPHMMEATWKTDPRRFQESLEMQRLQNEPHMAALDIGLFKQRADIEQQNKLGLLDKEYSLIRDVRNGTGNLAEAMAATRRTNPGMRQQDQIAIPASYTRSTGRYGSIDQTPLASGNPMQMNSTVEERNRRKRLMSYDLAMPWDNEIPYH